MQKEINEAMTTLKGCKFVGIVTYPDGTKKHFYTGDKKQVINIMCMYLREKCTVSIRAYKSTT